MLRWSGNFMFSKNYTTSHDGIKHIIVSVTLRVQVQLLHHACMHKPKSQLALYNFNSNLKLIITIFLSYSGINFKFVPCMCVK